MSTATRPTPKPRKHLMTPGQPPRQTREPMSLSSVQKWTMSTLAVSTILHFAAGLILAAAYVDEYSSKVGLVVLSGAFGFIAVAAGLLIHQKSVKTPWMLLGVLPPVIGAFLVL